MIGDWFSAKKKCERTDIGFLHSDLNNANMENQKTCSGNVGNTAPVMVSSDLSNTITNVVLLTLFPELCRLDEFLERNLKGTLQFRFEDDTTEYKELLHSTLVTTTTPVVSTNTTAGTVGYTADAAPSFPKGIKPDPDSKQNDVCGTGWVHQRGYGND